ncbi:HAD-IA family hydrolase [Clostridium cellulovorans]|uniref:HAD-superfamily hydrolase, subfamily IA, variant 3 n=1 Tax=Clostridium cellulovorans (strain ATCC 35296 / DSM 3052 / OCM 3 / 743B) TaxID=573061 RepID=D9SNG5_CLOC7|nr:HAD-IA family hydrolase [Clostridium cellulovorans]ADL53957.1 HAD-superfamily hydrolase, subfamily IA, variant 3 [Clostridium cellulovorans 743B]
MKLISTNPLSEYNNKIKAILFDSGRVLNVPTTGHWFITNNFFTYVDKKKFDSIPTDIKRLAFYEAGKFIHTKKLILDEQEEYTYFLEYYKIFSRCLPELGLANNDIESITKDYVYNYNKYSFFEDVINVIPKLSESYKLAVISDAWPSLENVYKAAGLRDYFSSFVISSKKGVSKPNELMYKTALEELDVSPDEALFIDDNIKNCDGALKLGINSLVLCRDLDSYAYHKLFKRNYTVVRNLTVVKNLLNI